MDLTVCFIFYEESKDDDELKEYEVNGEIPMFRAAERELNAMRRYSNIDYLVCFAP